MSENPEKLIMPIAEQLGVADSTVKLSAHDDNMCHS